MDEIEVVDEQPKLVQPDFVPEIPGIEMEEDHEQIDGKKAEEPVSTRDSMKSRIAQARHNAGLDSDKETPANPRGVEAGTGTSNDADDAVYDSPGSEPPPLVENVDSDDEDEEDGEPTVEPPKPELGRGKRIRRPTRRFIPHMRGQRHGEGAAPGVSFTQVKQPKEAEIVKDQFVGNGYSTKKGF